MRVIEYFPKTGIDCERIRAVSYHVTTAERRNFAEWCYVHSDAVCLIIGVFRQILRFHPESIRMDLAQNARSKLFLQSSVVGLSPFLNPLGSVLKLPNQQFDFHDIPHGFENDHMLAAKCSIHRQNKIVKCPHYQSTDSNTFVES